MHRYFSFWRIFLFICYWIATYHFQADNFLNAQTIPSSPLPPTHVHGHQISHQFASQTDLTNVITWNPPHGGTPPVSYYIYRNSHLTKLAAIIPAKEELRFKDHNLSQHYKYIYFIVSVDACGHQSDPVGIIFKCGKAHKLKPKRKLVSIQVEPSNPTISTGSTVQFTAIGIFCDQTTQNLTDQVCWTSSNPSVASISNAGLATGVSPGQTTITATLKGISGSTTLTVTSPILLSIEVAPVNPSLWLVLASNLQPQGFLVIKLPKTLLIWSVGLLRIQVLRVFLMPQEVKGLPLA